MPYNIFNAAWIVILLLSILVVVHELGHFMTARFFGVKVHEFAVGFGPLIGKFTHRGIQYSFRWILLGGFCKIAGMDMEIEGGAGEEPVRKEESFQYQALWKKICIIAAGPIFNLILAIILLFVTSAFIGLPSKFNSFSSVVEQAIPGTPAFDAGIKPGDKIVAINDNPIKDWRDISKFVQQYGSQPLTIKILRNQELLVKQITPMRNPAGKGYFIGINAVPVYERASLGAAAKIAITYPGAFIQSYIQTFSLMFKGKVEGRFMGPIGMVAVVEQMMRIHPYNIMSFAIQISLFLFLFNLLPLPLPLLDGGWIVILLLERLFRKEFSAEQKAYAQMIGLVAVIVLGLWIAYGDVINSFRRFFGG
ncbi:site-2 protease [Hydrogenispora ethanolica]|jgi:regulator of sigma E protease|uniref:Site-2 protease n=1 Tax=Hydrogenispora ethanolica TaxID=1082276 RepID=A0A4R1RSP8_HYDET|nr:M50 family metallopeptidase [Hydrogenispora ethanolica]TCL69414.1 site-2 protease [Hydrogenispora ethanolica]